MLVPCSGCGRHVRSTETACPFCGETIVAAAPRELAALPEDRRLTRAALTFATAAALATSACGKSNVEPPPPPPPATTMAPAYGVPPIDTTPTAVDAAAPDDAGKKK